MRKIFVSDLISVDGMFAGPGGDISWHNVDQEFNQFAAEMLNSVDTLIFGRTTYDLMVGFWPKHQSKAGTADAIVTEKMTSLKKIVFSKSMAQSDWANTTVYHDIDPTEIQKLKAGPGGDMVILGSGTIVQQMTELALIDEYWIMVNPVILGAGQSLFKDNHLKLKLTSSRQFANGNVLLKYQLNK
jgi:dihydrofolate reductase